MILLVTPIKRRDECAAVLQEAVGEPVVIAGTLAQATECLRTEIYTAAVLDQQFAELEPYETETLFEHLGAATPVQINLAISATDRVVREVRAALRRREYEKAVARQAAAASLSSRLNETFTKLLLDCELALETTRLEPEAAERLASVHETAVKLRAQLEAGDGN